MSFATDTRFFDVWIVERNTVYQKVPFTVVADWTQEGRLIDNDKVRPAGTTVWQKLVEHPLLTAYIPKPEPTHAEDTAEAFKAVELDFPGKPEEAEDNDPDMIPLIDISMVLLVFFMMTAQNLMSASPVDNPTAKYARITDAKRVTVVTMMLRGTKIEYYVGDNYKPENALSEETAVKRVQEDQRAQRNLRVIIQADQKISYSRVQELTLRLERVGIKLIEAKVLGAAGSGGEGGEVQ
jgi:biopolymer transport protein ExbD